MNSMNKTKQGARCVAHSKQPNRGHPGHVFPPPPNPSQLAGATCAKKNKLRKLCRNSKPRLLNTPRTRFSLPLTGPLPMLVSMTAMPVAMRISTPARWCRRRHPPPSVCRTVCCPPILALCGRRGREGHVPRGAAATGAVLSGGGERRHRRWCLSRSQVDRLVNVREITVKCYFCIMNKTGGGGAKIRSCSRTFLTASIMLCDTHRRSPKGSSKRGELIIFP